MTFVTVLIPYKLKEFEPEPQGISTECINGKNIDKSA